MNATPNRRGLLLSALTAAAGAAMSAISATEGPDPVVGFVEAHRAAWARLLDLENHTDDYERLEEAGRAADAALEEIMKTPPTTPAGARSVVEHLVEWDKDGARETSGQYLATLLRSPVFLS
jgi:hypothetical protein